MLEFETGSDGMAYLIASRIKGEREAFNVEGIVEKDEEMEKKERKQYMDINEAHQKFGHATESGAGNAEGARNYCDRKNVRLRRMCTSEGDPKRTNKTTKVTADKPGERLYMDTSGPYSKQSWGHATGSSLWMTKRESPGISTVPGKRHNKIPEGLIGQVEGVWKACEVPSVRQCW
ncbi:hypothetical protein MHU86_23654 [Fragilaria crotonensis]|nr:hypothetical protein MHU86_23654 [Fragilaria crotonensis]